MSLSQFFCLCKALVPWGQMQAICGQKMGKSVWATQVTSTNIKVVNHLLAPIEKCSCFIFYTGMLQETGRSKLLSYSTRVGK